MKLALRLVAFWVFSLMLGGGYASINMLQGVGEVSHASAALR